MPYINDASRDRLSRGGRPGTPGELNYAITLLVDAFLRDRGFCYENINAVTGALECAKLELYRRLAAPYEDTKIEANGDVYNAGPQA